MFVNSIDTIRRLLPLLSNLGLESVASIHGQMQQRQRLKHLDRFKREPATESHSDTPSSQNAGSARVLIASDVAGRGLDIPNVTHVIHYQIPRSADIYIHRTGRTGRAGQSGFSLLLLTPKEAPLYKKLAHHLEKGKEPETKYMCTTLSDLSCNAL